MVQVLQLVHNGYGGFYQQKDIAYYDGYTVDLFITSKSLETFYDCADNGPHRLEKTL
ncbi:MAG: hypothetical protein HF976_15155 [ANME-2 cluster archaeon]|nr:hypothetical protein [ANME-2 cluster archaeon]MBC2702714.1 hypothetical protein [ANME-2 cluster archaeon]MBC2707304.1 hypothetical protein [ANME-2 cluster archaeon]MBC2747163.1 hypothetical protein [ANME-2 cluster archaeon]